jgi:hypothetical protein
LVDNGFKARLDRALDFCGLTNARFAGSLGETGHQLVSNWRRRGRIGPESLPLVRPLLPGVSMDWLNDGAGSAPGEAEDAAGWKDIQGFAQAVGLGEGEEAQEYAETHQLKFRAVSLARKNLQAKSLAVMYGKGDSMLPRIHPGDAILFNRDETRPVDEALFVVMVPGVDKEIYSVKRCRVFGDDVYFEALNPAGDHNWRKPRKMDDKRRPIQILGRVRWIGSWED